MKPPDMAHDMPEESLSPLLPSTALERKRLLPLEGSSGSPAACKRARNETSETQPVD